MVPVTVSVILYGPPAGQPPVPENVPLGCPKGARHLLETF